MNRRVRRLIRPADAPQLATVRSLAYFLPVIDDVLDMEVAKIQPSSRQLFEGNSESDLENISWIAGLVEFSCQKAGPSKEGADVRLQGSGASFPIKTRQASRIIEMGSVRGRSAMIVPTATGIRLNAVSLSRQNSPSRR